MRLILVFILFQLSSSAQKMVFRSFEKGLWDFEQIFVLYPNHTFDCLQSMEYSIINSGTWDTTQADSIEYKFDDNSKTELLKIGESEFYKFTVLDGSYGNRYIRCKKFLNKQEISTSFDSVVIVKQGEVDSLLFSAYGNLPKQISLNNLEPGQYLVFLTNWINSSSNENNKPKKGILKSNYLILDKERPLKRLK